MNLEFGICWIEDQASDAEEAAIVEAVKSCGFEPSVRRISTELEIRALAIKQEHFQDFDLILLDLKLGNNQYGDELAPKIRSKFRSTPILFYSNEEKATLIKKMADKQVEGVYCTHRNDLDTRVRELVLDLSPALNRLSGMRGLAAHVVAECDNSFREILIHLEKTIGANVGGKAEVTAKLIKNLKDRELSVNRIGTFAELIDSVHVASGILFQLVRKWCQYDCQNREVLAAIHELRRYETLVLQRRNVLAHALEIRTDSGWLIRTKSHSSTVTVDNFEEFRADFLDQLVKVRKLRKLLNDT